MLFNEPKLLKCIPNSSDVASLDVSVLFNEPKLLKLHALAKNVAQEHCFSALQRAEIAEILARLAAKAHLEAKGFSALQRAEIAEIRLTLCDAQCV